MIGASTAAPAQDLGPQQWRGRESSIDAALARLTAEWPAAATDELDGITWTTRVADSGESITGLGPSVWVVHKGMVGAYQRLGSGARQMLALYVPGEVIDPLRIYRLTPGKQLMALGSASLMTPTRLAAAGQGSALSEALMREALREAAICGEWLANVGSRPALSRMAHFLCELAARSDTGAFKTGARCRMPLTQADLAEALGLSVVHVNRMLQQLRLDGLIALRARALTILDGPSLRQVADFDPAYLRRPEPLMPADHQPSMRHALV
jgi:CRP-like cAMP-binding protein